MPGRAKRLHRRPRPMLLASATALGASLMAASPAAAGCAEWYSYEAPSGMFGGGTALWNEHKAICESRERAVPPPQWADQRPAIEITATGSVLSRQDRRVRGGVGR